MRLGTGARLSVLQPCLTRQAYLVKHGVTMSQRHQTTHKTAYYICRGTTSQMREFEPWITLESTGRQPVWTVKQLQADKATIECRTK